MDKRLLAILGGIIAIFIGIFVITQVGNDNNGTSNSSSQPTSHIKGEGKKGVTLIEYGDYQCSVCAIYAPVLNQVYDRFSQDIYFQFRNLPLVGIHPNAFAAARAAEAAGIQDKYWEMYDKLYQNQNAWANSNNALSQFKAYAQGIGIDVDKFASDYAKQEINDAINADLAAFAKTGQSQATPTFFLNGKYIENRDLSDANGNPSVDKFAELINAASTQKSQ